MLMHGALIQSMHLAGCDVTNTVLISALAWMQGFHDTAGTMVQLKQSCFCPVLHMWACYKSVASTNNSESPAVLVVLAR